MIETFHSKSEEETKEFAKEFASSLDGYETIILTGDLGSGKTKFVEGFMEYWNFKEVSSPSFTIINEYKVSDLKTIYHFDVYRLEGIDDFLNIGGNEYFGKSIAIIEWGDNIQKLLPYKYIHIDITREYNDENERKIKVEYIGY